MTTSFIFIQLYIHDRGQYARTIMLPIISYKQFGQQYLSITIFTGGLID